MWLISFITLLIHSIKFWGLGGSLGLIFGGQKARARVILVLRECTWNALTVSRVLLAFDYTGSVGYPPRRVGDCLPFFVGVRESEIKPTTLSSLLISLSFLLP